VEDGRRPRSRHFRLDVRCARLEAPPSANHLLPHYTGSRTALEPRRLPEELASGSARLGVIRRRSFEPASRAFRRPNFFLRVVQCSRAHTSARSSPRATVSDFDATHVTAIAKNTTAGPGMNTSTMPMANAITARIGFTHRTRGERFLSASRCSRYCRSKRSPAGAERKCCQYSRAALFQRRSDCMPQCKARCVPTSVSHPGSAESTLLAWCQRRGSSQARARISVGADRIDGAGRT
jgi:hypothetical protein